MRVLSLMPMATAEVFSPVIVDAPRLYEAPEEIPETIKYKAREIAERIYQALLDGTVSIAKCSTDPNHVMSERDLELSEKNVLATMRKKS